MNWSDRISLQKILDKPRAFRYASLILGSKPMKKMILLSCDYPNSYSSSKNYYRIKNRKKFL